MGITDTGATANSIQSTFEDGFVNALFDNDELFNILRPHGLDEVQGTGTSFNWDVRNSKNTSVEVFTEHQAAPIAVAQGYAQASLNWVYLWIWYQITGMARDAIKDNPMLIFDQIASEFEMGIEDIKDLRTTTYLGATNNGLDVAVDDGLTYAGIARGSASYWESTVDSTSAALSLARLKAQHKAQREPEKGGKPTLHLCGADQLEAYSDLGGTIGAANASVRMHIPADGSPIKSDLGYDLDGTGFMNAPIRTMPDMDSDLFYSLDFRANGIKHVTIAQMETQFHSKSGDSDLYYTRTGGTLAIKNPVWQAKHEGLS